MVTYNHEKYIEQAVKSVLEQDVNFEYEIVVGEDGSTDTTASILRELERKNQNRIRVIYRPANLGAGANFLNTLSMCNGVYIAFLEGDDYWTSNNKLQRQVDFLNNNRGAAGVFHRTRAINGELGELSVFPAVDPPEFFSLDVLLRSNGSHYCHVSSLLARRACLRNIDSWHTSGIVGDWPLYIMLATQGDLGFIPLEMSHYRRHAGNNWSRLSLPHRMALVAQMLMHVMGLVSGKDKEPVEKSSHVHAHVWAELVTDTSVSIETVTNELNEIADFQLSNYLLAQVVAVARAKCEAQLSAQAQLSESFAKLKEEYAALSCAAQSKAEILEGELRNLQARAAALSEDLRAIRASRSWKITAPLRGIATVIQGR
jgi:hypothetical protein